MIIDCKTEAEWLECRKNYLTASDAGLYCDINPYVQNGSQYLYDVRKGLAEREDISGKPAVIRGKRMEEHLRTLFLLDHPEYDCDYRQYGIYVSEDRPYLAATLDGLLMDRDTGERWVLEIKTATVQRWEDFQAWRDGDVPQHYIAQGMHQLLCVPDAAGVVFWAYVVSAFKPDDAADNARILLSRAYRRDDPDTAEDIAWVAEMAEQFKRRLDRGERPRTTLRL